jgi:hypothetical protein
MWIVAIVTEVIVCNWWPYATHASALGMDDTVLSAP